MTDLATRPDPHPPSAARVGRPASPPAARLTPPRWRDRRLLLGVLLLLGSIMVGARVVGSAEHWQLVVVSTADLPAGHLLSAQDLSAQRVRLDPAAAGHYWAAAERPGLVGHRLVHGIAGGDLLPRAAVSADQGPALREVPVAVDPTRLPDLSAHDLVDVYVTLKPDGAAASVTQLLAGVEVGAVAASDGGAGKVRVLLLVEPGQVAALIRASELGELDLVAHLGDDSETARSAP